MLNKTQFYKTKVALAVSLYIEGLRQNVYHQTN